MRFKNDPSFVPISPPRSPTQVQTLRDAELVVSRRSHSLSFQRRYELPDGSMATTL